MSRLRSARARSSFTLALAVIAACGTAVWLVADPAEATRTTAFDAIASTQRTSGARAQGSARLAGWSARTASGMSAIDPRALGDRFERACHAGARIEDALDPRDEALPTAVVRRWESDGEAFVGCLVPGDRDALHRTLHARREGERTRWTMVWSAELATADALDAERHGEDLPGVPRPEGARRIASGAAASGERWVSYEAGRAGVRRALEDAGFATSTPRTQGSETVYLAHRGGRALFVVEGGTTVTLFESAGSWSAP